VLIGRLMPVPDLHRTIAAIALSAAAQYGFALGGGNALLVHGIGDRLTDDVDLFTDQQDGVARAADSVEVALRSSGFTADRRDSTGDSADFSSRQGEWLLTADDGQRTKLRMAYYYRHNPPVQRAVGPVLDVEDAVGSKVCALAGRVATRDYIDTAAALQRYTVDEVIGFARRIDPGLTDRDFAAAAWRLDDMDDALFFRSGLSPQDVAELRERFADWPRG
jgi:Nucleotidyl transferase AbiEii toxin, Type IV TA system